MQINEIYKPLFLGLKMSMILLRNKKDSVVVTLSVQALKRRVRASVLLRTSNTYISSAIMSQDLHSLLSCSLDNEICNKIFDSTETKNLSFD
jgi:hypothetical protein